MQDPPRREPRPLRVRVSFEPTRLAAEQLAAAYDQVLPPLGRRLRAPVSEAHLPAESAQATREEEHA